MAVVVSTPKTELTINEIGFSIPNELQKMGWTGEQAINAFPMFDTEGRRSSYSATIFANAVFHGCFFFAKAIIRTSYRRDKHGFSLQGEQYSASDLVLECPMKLLINAYFDDESKNKEEEYLILMQELILAGYKYKVNDFSCSRPLSRAHTYKAHVLSNLDYVLQKWYHKRFEKQPSWDHFKENARINSMLEKIGTNPEHYNDEAVRFVIKTIYLQVEPLSAHGARMTEPYIHRVSDLKPFLSELLNLIFYEPFIHKIIYEYLSDTKDCNIKGITDFSLDDPHLFFELARNIFIKEQENDKKLAADKREAEKKEKFERLPAKVEELQMSVNVLNKSVGVLKEDLGNTTKEILFMLKEQQKQLNNISQSVDFMASAFKNLVDSNQRKDSAGPGLNRS